MTLQSLTYYAVTALIIFNSGTLLLFPLIELLLNGFVVRLGLLILVSPLFYLVFRHLTKSKTIDATIS